MIIIVIVVKNLFELNMLLLFYMLFVIIQLAFAKPWN